MIVHVPYVSLNSLISVSAAGTMEADMPFSVLKTRLGLIAMDSPNLSQCSRRIQDGDDRLYAVRFDHRRFHVKQCGKRHLALLES